MSEGQSYRYVCVVLFCLLLTGLGSASGFDSVNIEEDDIEEDEIKWFDPEGPNIESQELEGGVSCTEDNEEFQSLILSEPSGNERSLNASGNTFSYDFLESSYGSYTLNLDCGENNYEYGFNLNYFSVEDYSYEKSTVYQSETQRITFNFDVRGIEYNTGELGIRQASSDIDLYGLELVSASQGKATFRFRTSTSEEPRDNIEIFWDVYMGDKFTVQPGSDNNVFNLKEPWNVITTENYVGKETSLEELSENRDLFKIDADYRGESHGFRPDHFKLKVIDEEGDEVLVKNRMETEASDNGRLITIGDQQFSDIKDSLPRGEYTFEVWIDENENYLIDDFTVYNYVVFSGVLENSNKNPVDAFFEIKKDGDIWRSFNTNNGEYSDVVLPGYHNVTMRTEDDVTFEFESTKFGANGERRIMYDRIPRAELDNVEGVEIVKAFGALYGYPFEKGNINVKHGFGDVNAEDARIIRCSEWSMNRECGGEWKNFDKSEIKVDPTVPSVEFPIEPDRLGNQSYLISAYALVENQDLVADVEIGSSRMPVGEDVNVNGQVSAAGSSVDEVDVKIDILNGDEVISSYTEVTDNNGAFDTTIAAPEESGVYDIRITGEKQPYSSFNLRESGAIDTYVQREISVNGPNQAEFKTGKTSEITYTIVNEGQEDLEDIRFRISGLNNEWYDVSSSSWKNLEAGSKVTTNVKVEIPNDYFDSENLENEKFDVEVRALSSEGEMNKIESTVGTITNEYQYASSSDENKEEEDGSLLNSMNLTGGFIQSTSTMNVALGVIMLFTTLLAAAVKKNKSASSDDRGRRGDNRNSPISSSSSSAQGIKPNVSANNEVNDDDESIKEDEANNPNTVESEDENIRDPNSENEKPTCDICGEIFDTSSGVKLHKQAIH